MSAAHNRQAIKTCKYPLHKKNIALISLNKSEYKALTSLENNTYDIDGHHVVMNTLIYKNRTTACYIGTFDKHDVIVKVGIRYITPWNNDEHPSQSTIDSDTIFHQRILDMGIDNTEAIIVKYFGTYHCGLFEFYITERWPCDLHSHVGKLDESSFNIIATRIITLIELFHTQLKHIHCDIKPQNMVINDKFEIRLIDFGISHIARVIGIVHCDINEGTSWYKSIPSYSGDNTYSYIFDIESLFYSLEHLWTGTLPWIDCPDVASTLVAKQSFVSIHPRLMKMQAMINATASHSIPNYDALRSIFME